MIRAMGVAFACLALAVVGCGGVAELDSGEVSTVTEAKAAAQAAAAGSLTPAGEKALEDLKVLCHEKPLAEADGDSIREIVTGIVPQLKNADPAYYKRFKKFADHGCY